jgi:hypothetical protein
MSTRAGPSFVSVVFAVYVSGGIASLATSRIAAGVVLGSSDQHLSRADAVHKYLLAQALTLVVTTVVAAGIVYFILALDGSGPSFLRALFGVAVGSAIGSAIALYVVLEMRPPTGPAQAAPFVNAVQSLVYAPLMFVGLFVSALIIYAGSGRIVPTTSGEMAWEYKLPPGATWRQ